MDVSAEDLLTYLNVDKHSILYEIMQKSNHSPPPTNLSPPPPPPDLSLAPPPPSPKSKTVSFRLTTTEEVSKKLVEIGGSKWMRGKVASVILALVFQGKIGGSTDKGGIAEMIKKKLRKKKKKKNSGDDFKSIQSNEVNELKDNKMYKKIQAESKKW